MTVSDYGQQYLHDVDLDFHVYLGVDLEFDIRVDVDLDFDIHLYRDVDFDFGLVLHLEILCLD